MNGRRAAVQTLHPVRHGQLFTVQSSFPPASFVFNKFIQLFDFVHNVIVFVFAIQHFGAQHVNAAQQPVERRRVSSLHVLQPRVVLADDGRVIFVHRLRWHRRHGVAVHDPPRHGPTQGPVQGGHTEGGHTGGGGGLGHRGRRGRHKRAVVPGHATVAPKVAGPVHRFRIQRFQEVLFQPWVGQPSNGTNLRHFCWTDFLPLLVLLGAVGGQGCLPCGIHGIGRGGGGGGGQRGGGLVLLLSLLLSLLLLLLWGGWLGVGGRRAGVGEGGGSRCATHQHGKGIDTHGGGRWVLGGLKPVDWN